MTERIYLHIGAPKTGTTYLQEVLATNRQAMKRDGLLYPKLPGIAHHSALWDLRQMWKEREFNVEVRGHWDRVVAKVTAWDGPAALLSSELFVYAQQDEVVRALTSFGDIEVHVIYTARDLVRQVPAVWQERLKNQHTMRYDAFVSDVIGRSRSGMAKSFWLAQDAPKALARWSHGLRPEHVHVVTMPPSGSAPDQLWNRFASVVGLDGTQYVADVPATNTSFGAVEAEVLRRLNERQAGELGAAAYRRVVRYGLFDVLDRVVPDKTRITLSPEEHAALVTRSDSLVADLRAGGFDIVGDLADLTPAPFSPPKVEQRRPGDVTEAEVNDALLDALFVVLRRGAKKKAEPALAPAGDSDESEATPD
ncbi:MAG: hypothetical protein WBV37_07895 [Nocardioidaceae bacterium]